MIRVVMVMIGVFFFKLGLGTVLPPEVLREDVHGVASFLEVLGALYGIILAFVIFVVWDQFNKVQTGIYLEASALEDLCHTASFISDSETAHKLKFMIRGYIEMVVGDEARCLARGEMCASAANAFIKVSDAVRAVEIKVPKDQIVFSGLLDALVRVNNVRDARLGVSGARIPGTLWTLILFFSCALVSGFLLLGFRLIFMGDAMVAIIAGSIVFLLQVISDIDNPFDGNWNISYSPFSSVLARLKTQK